MNVVRCTRKQRKKRRKEEAKRRIQGYKVGHRRGRWFGEQTSWSRVEKGRGDREKEGKRTRRVFKYSFRVRPVEFASDHSAPRFPCPSPILLDAPPLPLKITEIRAIFERRRLFENKISHEGEGVCGKLGHGIDWKFIYFFIHSYRRAFTTFDTGFLVARGGA